MAGNFVIQKDTVLMCPQCKKSDYAIIWDEATKEMCTSRQLRRAYKSLIGMRRITRETTLHYRCPHCNRFIEGWKIAILKNNGE